MLVKGRLWDRKNRRHHGKKSTKAAAGEKDDEYNFMERAGISTYVFYIALAFFFVNTKEIRRAIGRFKRSHYVVRQVNVGQQQHLIFKTSEEKR
ncbi:nuclear factor of activated T-cells 5 isoform X2 [Vespula squamosa]|uniref:Nuclear factor of activated T-cells 5 isoform X2 n=1 Tax=Vespula squamosa TaxID=30214 RepID=A0ABD2A5V0_VESSQ